MGYILSGVIGSVVLYELLTFVEGFFRDDGKDWWGKWLINLILVFNYKLNKQVINKIWQLQSESPKNIAKLYFVL